MKESKNLEKIKKEKSRVLLTILREIEESRISDAWECSSEFIFDELGIDRTEFVKFCYKNQYENSDYGDGLNDSFGPENIFELVQFLQELGYESAEPLFYRKGFYLNAEQGAICLEYFHSFANHFFNTHEIDKDLLEVSLSGCKKEEDAFDFYCKNIFELQDFVKSFSHYYFTKTEMEKNPHSVRLISEFVSLQFGHQSYFEELFFSKFKEKLRLKAIEWELIESPSSEKHYREYAYNVDKRSRNNLPREIFEAIKVLSLQNEKQKLTKEILRKRYCECLKQSHPDLRKNTNKDVRDVISAYNLLLNSVSLNDGISLC